MVTFEVAIDAIMDAIIAKLEAARVPGGKLATVVVIARGDRSIPSPETPAIYIRPMEVVPNSDTTTLTTKWDLPVHIGVMTQADKSDYGYQSATALAARAMNILTLERLNLVYTYKPRAKRVIPSSPNLREGDYFGARAEITVAFETQEV